MLPPSRTLKYNTYLGVFLCLEKSKIDLAEKVIIVERLLADEISISEAARVTGVARTSIRRWRDLYLSDGPTALMPQAKNKFYSPDLKLQAVHEYLDRRSSPTDINYL